MEIKEQSKFIIETTMTKEDYKKFLCIATFSRNKLLVLFMILLSLLGSLAIGFDASGLAGFGLS